MLTLSRSKWMVVCIALILAVLAATSCAPAATPTPTPLPVPTFTPTVVGMPTPIPTATPVAVATPTPVAEETPAPAPEVVPEEVLYLPELPRTTCEELKQAMDEGVDLVSVDTRIDFSFKEGHIPGAINIPDTPLPPLTEEMVTERLLELPMDKLIFLYCD